MDGSKLRKYKSNKRELESINTMLLKLHENLEAIPDVSVKVQKSGDDFPYIEEHVTVKAKEPNRETEIKNRIRVKKRRKAQLEEDIEDVEGFIAGMTEGVEKQIFEMVYLEDMSQREVADVVGYTQGRIAQIIKRKTKD